MPQTETPATESPSTLVAIIVAARLAGDRELESEMRRRLRNEHGVTLQFPRRREVAP